MVITERKRYHAIAIISLIIFVILKWSDVKLPYFWDEAWSYGPAVYHMYEKGPSLLPGVISDWDSRGHPLLFYFLAALWLKIFGYSILNAHLFALTISIVLSLSVYFILGKYFNYRVALAGMITLMCQEIFFVQSIMLMPEVLLALFALLVFFSYFENKILWFNFFATCSIFTKETGIAILLTVFLYDIYKNCNNTLKYIIFRQLKLFTIPAVLISIFFIIQKLTYGWFFYPDHIGKMTNHISEILNRFNGYSLFLFFRHGRNLMSITILIFIIILFFKKISEDNKKSFYQFSLLFIIIYLLLLAINFPTLRYLLSIFPFFVIIFVLAIESLIFKKNWFFWLTVIVFSSISGYYTYANREISDVSLGYRDMVEVHKNTVKFLEENNLYDEKIATHFLMIYNLTHPEIGYLSAGKKFNHVSSTIDTTSTKYVIVSNIEQEFANPIVHKIDSITIKTFSKNNAWCKILQLRN